ncbi:MAG: DUF2095 family protein [Candidatus Hermodarchaeota archaeon]
MDKKLKDKDNAFKKPKIIDFDGLKIAYEKTELEKQFPNLMSEISNKKKSIKIDSVDFNIESKSKAKNLTKTEDYKEDLINPGVIDFIRRCTNNSEALEILEYLLKRKEINLEFYKKLKNQIRKKDGLEKLIKDCGGLKKPGYYERKYYSKKV